MRRDGAARMNPLLGLALLGLVAVAIVALVTSGPREPRTGRRYAQDVRAAGQVDPGRIAWEEILPPLAVAMEAPVAVALDAEGRILVLGDRLVVLGPDGRQESRTAELAARYRGLAAAAAGRIYAAAPDRVDLLALDGGRLEVERSAAAPDVLASFAAIALAPAGVLVADAGGRRVLRRPRNLGGDWQELAGGFVVPSVMDVAVTAGGDPVTVDPGRHTVQVRDGYGDVLRSFGRMGGELADFAGCCNPAAIAMTADGRTVTAEKGLGATRVKIYDASGRFESAIAGPSAFDAATDDAPIVLDVAVDSRGRVLVLDPARRQVRVFAPKEEKKDG
ncbi:MAG: hypothetical protein AB1726_04660 [Planctomycetota bacterium]